MNRQTTQAPWRGGGSHHAVPEPYRAEADELGLLDLFNALFRWKWWIAGAALFGAALAAIVVSLIPPVYTASSQVMLDTRERRVTTTAEVVSGLTLSDPVIETEVQVIRSNLLLDSVVRHLGPERLVEYDTSIPDPGIIGRLFGSETAAAPELSRDERISAIVRGLLRNLDVWQHGSSYVLNIAVRSGDPVLAGILSDAIARAYILAQLDLRTEGTRRATEWLTERVAVLKTEVAASQRAVERFRIERALPATGVGPMAAPRELDALSAQIASARADFQAAKARHDRIAAARDTQGLDAVAALLASPLAERLRAERAELELEDARLAARYGARHPDRARAAAEIARVDEAILTETDRILARLASDVAVAEDRERALVALAQQLETRIAEMSQAEIALRQLEIEAAANERVYQNLLSRLKETRTQEALAQADATMITRAMTPEVPTHPRKKLIVALGGVLGLLLSAGAVLGRELTLSGYRSASPLEADTGLPVLAALSRPPSLQPVRLCRHLLRAPHCAFSENLRLLRLTLEQTSSAHQAMSVLVTSTTAREGRSTTALALAASCGRAGHRTLLLDADFYGASPWRAYAEPRGYDLIAALNGEIPPEAAIASVPDLDIDILAAAGPAFSLADAIGPDQVRVFVEHLSRAYDAVIIDGPALDRAADINLLAEAADTLAYVVRSRTTPSEEVQRGLAVLNELGRGPRGLVLTYAETASGGGSDRWRPGKRLPTDSALRTRQGRPRLAPAIGKIPA
ncbi:MAG: polysaccharide biosynthesis tyrosine autokinase [Pseudomonadota bacterium]